MDANQKGLTHLVNDIFNTEMQEIQCAEAAEQMVLCADALLSDEESQRRYPQLWRHMRVCVDCAREYQMLMELAHLESAGQLSRPADIPPIPDSSESSLLSRIERSVRAIFPGFAPDLSAALTRSERLGTEPVEVEFGDGDVVITLDVDKSEQHPSTRDLFCQIEVADGELMSQLESQPVWLRISQTDAIVQDQALDEMGDSCFSSIEPGTYDLHVSLGGQEYVVQGIGIP